MILLKSKKGDYVLYIYKGKGIIITVVIEAL